ncbi:glycosyltransferase [Robertkochia marina]|uniref:Glycosyltransferase n=1 Tax=Robertkochia marina TaxID=1227945 RepID=A0A4S3M4Q0_9FLAO|nr:TIGR04282 family arsenosugar biosynthesis glycosyltransferase [Robertkochia marina]THD69815.1 glycosyltransferase [Robertkochia marina]TRZ46840.1 glycosyltransferase [Robertkochia marina]
MEKELLVFVKNPVAGKVKTRLAKDIGKENALSIYRSLLQHTASVCIKVTAPKSIYFSEKIIENPLWNHPTFSRYVQEGENLGIRMENAFREAFKRGRKKVVIIGSDLYDLREDLIEDAFLKLENNDVVIGPAADGGYYLLGLKEVVPGIFDNKTWGSSLVLEATLEDLKGYNVALLRELNDVDNLDDLKMHPELMNEIHIQKDGKTT